MAAYDFAGIDASGKNIKGVVEAESERGARQKLRRDGIFATSIKTRTGNAGSRKGGDSKNKAFSGSSRINMKDLSDMTRQLSTLVKAKVPLVDALGVIQEQQEKQKLRDIISDVKSRVNEGSSLAKAMREYPKVFSPLYTSMIRAGQASGALEIVLMRLADFIERNARLRSKIVASMVYPLILGVVSLIIVSALLTFIVPKMTEMFQDQNRALPMITQILIFMSEIFKEYWYLMVSFAGGGIYLFRKYINTEAGRKWYDEKLLNLPLFGTTIRKIAISRFARTLSTLLASGVSIVSALDIVKEVVANVVIGESVEKVKDGVVKGETMAKNLRTSGHFPPIVTHMIAVGEKSGGRELEEMLENIAEAYDGEVENSLTTLTSVIEPLMIVLLGGFVAFVVMAIITPIMEMTKIN